jgi:hypothetical protein
MDIFDSIRLNQPSEVQKHIDAGANLEQCNDRGIKPVVLALENVGLSGDATILRLLRKAGARPEPLAHAIERRLDELSQDLIHEHKSTTECINKAVRVLQSRMGRLTSDQRQRAQTFLRSAEAFWRSSSSLQDRLPLLRAQWSQQGEHILEEVASYLGEVTKLRINGIQLRMESTVIEQG